MCGVGATPGFTKSLQEIVLDKHVRLIDSPGIVFADNKSEGELVLRNCVKLEKLADPITPVEVILQKCAKSVLIEKYGVAGTCALGVVLSPPPSLRSPFRSASPSLPPEACRIRAGVADQPGSGTFGINQPDHHPLAVGVPSLTCPLFRRSHKFGRSGWPAPARLWDAD